MESMDALTKQAAKILRKIADTSFYNLPREEQERLWQEWELVKPNNVLVKPNNEPEQLKWDL